MIYTGIDVAKDKHDCFITNSKGEVLFKAFTIPNNRDGFDELYQKITSVTDDLTKVKVGLDATGHYCYNILGYLLDKGLATFVINPLHTNLYRKSLSLRKTKTDKVDAHTIATMLISDVNLKSYSNTSYHNEELKSLTRYRFDKVKERAKLKSSVSRLVTILFREAARTSIGSHMPAKSLEIKHTIKLIQEITDEIDEIEDEIKSIMDEINTPILSIPGINYRMGAMIIAEIGDFSRFDSPDNILAYAGMSPSTYQSGQLESSYSHMEKRGSRYLRYALYNATKYVCHWDPTFAAYFDKKRSEGKHYNVAISHATKKLVRVIYQLHRSGQAYIKSA